MNVLLILTSIISYVVKLGVHFFYVKKAYQIDLRFRFEFPGFGYLLMVFLFPIFRNSNQLAPYQNLEKYRIYGNIAYVTMFILLILFVVTVDNKSI
jgi:hypothetical protein